MKLFLVMRTILTALFTLFIFTVVAQRPQGERPPIATIFGRVLDNQTGKPIEFATITVVSARDSSIETGGISGSDGRFKIEQIRPGGYTVQVTFIGYEVKRIQGVKLNPQAGISKDLGDIRLNFVVNEIGTAVIEEKKEYMELMMDKKVFNVDQVMGATGGVATDILETIPSVQVDVDGNISLRGSQNVTVLIDGKPSALTGSSRQAILQQLPASSIERVEVITNPSAKYDPDGMTGIINIVLKKNKLAGFHGNVQLTYGTGDNYNASLGLNLRTSKFNIFSNYSFNYNDRFSRGYTDRLSFATGDIQVLDQQNRGNRVGFGHTIKAGTDFYASSTTTFNVSGTYNISEDSDNDSVFNKLSYTTGEFLSAFDRNSAGSGNRNGYDLTAGMRKELKGKDHLWTIDGQFSSFDGNSVSDIENIILEANGSNSDTAPFFETNASDDQTQTITLQTDYSKATGENGKLEAGYKLTDRNMLNDFYAEFRDTLTGNITPYLDRNNIFRYTEQIHAAYGTYGYKWERITAQGGMRAEQVFTESKLLDTDETFVNDYFALFPSGFLTYKMSKASDIQLSYSRRINRPNTRQLNPFANYSDNLNLRRGNPYLLPEFVNAIDLSYSIKKESTTYIFSAYVHDVNQVIRRFKTIDTLGVSTTTYENQAGSQNIGIEGVVNLDVTKWWSLNMSFNGYRVNNDGTNLESDLSNIAYSWTGRVMSTMKFNNTMQLQATGFYRAPENTVQGRMSEMYFIDLAYKVSFFKGKGSLTVNLRDVFDTRQFSFSSFGRGFEQESLRKRESRNLFVSLSWRFGKLEVGRERRGRGEGNSDGGGMEID